MFPPNVFLKFFPPNVWKKLPPNRTPEITPAKCFFENGGSNFGGHFLREHLKNYFAGTLKKNIF
jgi:hypothetical protein